MKPRDTITYWAPDSSTGGKSFLPPVLITGVWQNSSRVVEEITIEVDCDLAEGGYLFRGASPARDLLGIAGARPVLRFYTAPDHRTLRQSRTAVLGVGVRQALHAKGMHGLGDNIHQRAVVRQWLAQGHQVHLESSWVSVYWDLIEQGLRVHHKPSALRTQMKNARRESRLFAKGAIPSDAVQKEIWWRANDIRRVGSVLGAMCLATGVDASVADFRMPIHPLWLREAREWTRRWKIPAGRPIMVYRPLIERTEWSGCATRNPDHEAYSALYEAIRSDYFVVSIADLEPLREWSVGRPFEADVCMHHGELTTEAIAALMSQAALVITSPGFAVPMAQSVGTPVVCVFGGYEDSHSFALGAKFGAYLGVDPIKPCQCFLHSCACTKAIDIPRAITAVREFSRDAIQRWSHHHQPQGSVEPLRLSEPQSKASDSSTVSRTYTSDPREGNSGFA